MLRRKPQTQEIAATHSFGWVEPSHQLRASLSPSPSQKKGLVPSQEGVGIEEGRDSSYYSLLFPDRETEAGTLSNLSKFTKLRSGQDSNPGLINSKYFLGNYLTLWYRVVVLKLSLALESLGWLVGPTPRIFDLVALGFGSRTCIFNKFPDSIDSTGPGTTLWEQRM